MIDPYRMVFVNIVASLLLIVGTLFYRFIYPKKKINLFVLLLLVSILPIISIFRPGDYESGDFNIHIYRIISFFNSLKEGILMPSWAAELNYSYGNPLFIFNYSLPYYIISLFHFLGLTFITATKLYLGITLYFSGIFMYFAVKELTNNKIAAFTSAIFYTFSPYHLIDVHFRATLGESTIFLLVPVLFLTITKYLKEKKVIFLVANSLITTLLVMAHPLLGTCFCLILTAYTLYFVYLNKDTKTGIYCILSMLVGGIAASYAWLPFIIYVPYMFSIPTSEPIFYAYNLLFYSPWRLGLLFQGPKGELAEIIGYTQVFVVLFLATLFLKNKIKNTSKYLVLFWISVIFIILLLMHPVSSSFWNLFPLFWMLLPFGRLLLIVSFSTSILAGYLALIYSGTRRKNILILLLVVTTIGYTILNWGHRRLIPQITDDVLVKNIGASTLTEGTTAYFLNNKWADINNFWFTSYPKEHMQILRGEGKLKQITRSSIQHVYLVDARTQLVIQENTLYFPGWQLKSDNKNIKIFPGKRGVINAVLPQGIQKVKLYYEDIPVYKAAKTINIFYFISVIFLLAYYLVFLPIQNISPGKRKIQLGLNIKKGLRNFISQGRK